MTIAAKYEDGVFRPLENVTIKEGTIVEVRVPSESGPRRERPSIKDFPFYGMWADRDDIADGISYVNNLRDKSSRLMADGALSGRHRRDDRCVTAQCLRRTYVDSLDDVTISIITAHGSLLVQGTSGTPRALRA